MTSKAAKCCCCPPCTVKTKCCKCVCRRICVVFTSNRAFDEDGNECKPRSVELDWNEAAEHWQGSLLGFDLKYYFDEDETGCYLKLRSSALDFPEGYERAWKVGHYDGEVSCSNPITEVAVPADYDTSGTCVGAGGTISTACAIKINPTHCSGCACACECLCVTYTKGECVAGGKACWDGYGNWRATLNCGRYGPDIEIVIAMFALNQTCNPYVDPYCDPDDDRCVLVLSLDNTPAGQHFPNCPDIAAAWTIPHYPDEDVYITARCAICSEDCEIEELGCCPDFAIPETLFCTLTIQIQLKKAQGGPVPDDVGTPFDCATYVFPLEKVPYSASNWESGFYGIPMPACFGNSGTVLGGLDPCEGTVRVGCQGTNLFLFFEMSGGADRWTIIKPVNTVSCEPFYAHTIIGRTEPFFWAIPTGGTGIGDQLTEQTNVQSSCCGPPIHQGDVSMFYATRLTFEVTG